MKSAWKLTHAQRNEVARLYREGVPIKDIAAMFGVHLNTPSRLARRRGCPPRYKRKGAAA